MTVRFPLCPYERHPLLEPKNWINRLIASDLVIKNGRLDVIPTASNSFALILNNCSLYEKAAEILRNSIRIVEKNQSISELWLDSYLNLLRMASRKNEVEKFRIILDSCIKSAVYENTDLFYPVHALQLPSNMPKRKKLYDILKIHLIYETLACRFDENKNYATAQIIKNEEHFSKCGLIWKEFSLSKSNKFVEPGALSNLSGGLIEGLIHAVYATDFYIYINEHKMAEDYFSMSIFFLLKFSQVGKLDRRFLHIFAEMHKQSEKMQRNDVKTLIVRAALAASGEDWYMRKRFESLRDGVTCLNAQEFYRPFVKEVTDIFYRWTAFEI